MVAQHRLRSRFHAPAVLKHLRLEDRRAVRCVPIAHVRPHVPLVPSVLALIEVALEALERLVVLLLVVQPVVGLRPAPQLVAHGPVARARVGRERRGARGRHVGALRAVVLRVGAHLLLEVVAEADAALGLDRARGLLALLRRHRGQPARAVLPQLPADIRGLDRARHAPALLVGHGHARRVRGGVRGADVVERGERPRLARPGLLAHRDRGDGAVLRQRVLEQRRILGARPGQLADPHRAAAAVDVVQLAAGASAGAGNIVAAGLRSERLDGPVVEADAALLRPLLLRPLLLRPAAAARLVVSCATVRKRSHHRAACGARSRSERYISSYLELASQHDSCTECPISSTERSRSKKRANPSFRQGWPQTR